jgi:hypothetical protein
MRNKILISFFIAMMGLVIYSCNKEDYTGHSDLTPSNPTITVDVPTGVVSLIESDYTYTYTVTLSEPQIVDVAIYVTQIEGDATLGEDFDIANTSSRVYIPAYATTGTLSIKIKADDFLEGTETFKLQIGDERTANATITPVTVDFSLTNLTKGDLAVTMSWALPSDVEYFDIDGELIPADDIADMIMTIVDAGTPIGTVDGGTFEDYVFLESLPDGVYTIEASFYAVADLPAVSLDMTLDFYQWGLINTSATFEAIANTGSICDFVATLATVTKVGSTYTIENVGTSEYNVDYTKFEGNFFDGVDGSYKSTYNWMYPSEITATFNGTELNVDGVNFGWMPDVWGETVISTIPFKMTLNTDGTLTIEDQLYMTTDYSDYRISGTGNWSSCDPSSFVIHYDMYCVLDDYSVGEWLFSHGYSATNYFIATVNLGAKKSVSTVTNVKKIH